MGLCGTWPRGGSTPHSPDVRSRMKNNTTATIVLAFVLICGCTSHQSTTEYSIDSPWNSPQGKAVTSEHTYLVYMAAGSSSDLYWTLSSGHRVKVAKYARKLEKYLLNAGYIDAWPGTGSHINDTEQKNAPYRLFFVSIEPVIVIMVPWEQTPNKSCYTEDLQKYPRQQIHTDYLRFPFEFGTRIPYSDELIVLHLDDKAESKIRIPAKDVIYTLEHEDVILKLTRKDKVWVVSREK